MIKQKTVFVLGAGASVPYGFPSGIELKNQIISLFKRYDTPRVQSILLHLQDESPAAIANGFREALLYSGKNSVDAFLEHRPNLVELGKLAIATILIPCENQGALFTMGIKGDWYQYLYQKMNAPFHAFGDNQVAFITYNYDRSLEHYLFTALRNSYGRSQDDVAAQLGKIPFIHLHGQLGPLPWQGSLFPREFKSDENSKSLKIAANGIKIIHEKAHNDSAFSDALEHLSAAKKIIFLGFGYDPTNLSRLHIEKLLGQKISLMGSCYGFTQLERGVLADKFRKRITLGEPGEDALSFLRERIVLE